MAFVGAVVEAPAAHAAYGWPVRPFDKPHPVRGNFGDPRITPRSYQFHFGVDISARDGTRVYATMSGTVYVRSGHTDMVGVSSPDGTLAFEYWHVVPAVGPGQTVTAYKTVIGRIVEGQGHVHLSELRGGAYINPLRRGALRPYRDRTRPTIGAVTFLRRGQPVAADRVRGRVDIVANAFDTPALASPRPWLRKPVAPALVRWRLLRGGRAVTPWRTAVDFRRFLPPKSSFWNVYAAGTRPNGRRRSGRYRFYLARSWNSTRVGSGAYRLQVAASDIRGNRGGAAVPFVVG